MCKTCNNEIEITQNIFMGMNNHFCSYLCRRYFFIKNKKQKLDDEKEKEKQKIKETVSDLTIDRNNSILQQILNLFL
jgi:CRISPR/Cas system-associated protein Cas10 (large subunit of type III CRISPR-Cas system)